MIKMMALKNLYKETHWNIVSSIDVEAWNNTFNSILCQVSGREFFDRIFETSCYEFVMDIFNESLFLLTDMVRTWLWDGQNGGIEGLCQKFWSWIYSALALKTARLTGHLFYILINGDDCRIFILLSKDLIAKNELNDVLSQMAIHFKSKFLEFGFNLKLEETYYSESLLEFGKVYLYNNASMTCTLKKGSKFTD